MRVIIAGAGGAAHLAGVIAAETTLPVIGVPIPSTPLAGLDEYRTTMATARRLVEGGQIDAAVAPLEHAKTLFPQYGGDDSPTWHLAQIYLKRGDTRRAAEELKQVVASNEANYAAQMALADALQKLGDNKGAAASLAAALYINPFELPVHQRLAELAKATGDVRMVVRERRAVVALAPVDECNAGRKVGQKQRLLHSRISAADH